MSPRRPRRECHFWVQNQSHVHDRPDDIFNVFFSLSKIISLSYVTWDRDGAATDEVTHMLLWCKSQRVWRKNVLYTIRFAANRHHIRSRLVILHFLSSTSIFPGIFRSHASHDTWGPAQRNKETERKERKKEERERDRSLTEEFDHDIFMGDSPSVRLSACVLKPSACLSVVCSFP